MIGVAISKSIYIFLLLFNGIALLRIPFEILNLAGFNINVAESKVLNIFLPKPYVFIGDEFFFKKIIIFDTDKGTYSFNFSENFSKFLVNRMLFQTFFTTFEYKKKNDFSVLKQVFCKSDHQFKLSQIDSAEIYKVTFVYLDSSNAEVERIAVNCEN